MRRIIRNSSFFFLLLNFIIELQYASSKTLPDRGRVVQMRKSSLDSSTRKMKKKRKLNSKIEIEAIEGPKYRANRDPSERSVIRRHEKSKQKEISVEQNLRKLGQLTSCCTTYKAVSAYNLCGYYGQDCSSGEEPSHDSGDESCEMEGLAFIGISFSVNTAKGNPYSYHLQDQMPMENLIDRNYDYIMSMDEDGWLVGGGYKPFDYSGKMPYIDSSHTELLRIGSLDPEYGGTSIQQVYNAMSMLSFPPFSVFPEYVKGGGGGHSGDDGGNSVPSGDVTLIVSIAETYNSGYSYSDYEKFLNDLFQAMYNVGGGACMDDHDTDPHVSMARGVKFFSSYHSSQYFYTVNLEVAVWQAMYPKGVVMGTSGTAAFPPDKAMYNRKTVGYGNLYFFFDRANITTSFPANRDISNSEKYYSTLYSSGGSSNYYASVTTISFDYTKSSHDSGDNNEQQNYEHNPYNWDASMAKHDMTDGWDLPPNCEQEGEGFFGIPLSRRSASKLQSTETFQRQFDFEPLLDRNFTYIKKFGTNHGWLLGEKIGNGPASITDKDTAHIPIFYYGTTNPDKGGVALSDVVKLAKSLEFGTLYIKPAFVFQDDDSSLKVQFEADSNSALGYLYDNLCKMLGITWNYKNPSNDLGVYTNCAMHATGDRSSYGCGPGNSGAGGFCPQMTIAYRVSFQSDDLAYEYLQKANDYVDYWRSLYPTGVAVGTSKFCPDGGCLGLYLNRMDLYSVYKPDLGGSWVEFNGGTAAPTISPAPTFEGGCDNPRNRHLDKCFREFHKPKALPHAWDSLGTIGQLSILLVSFMATTLTVSIFLTRARKRKRAGESYIGFFLRDLKRKKKRRKKLKKTYGNSSLSEDMLPRHDDDDDGFGDMVSRRSRGGSRSRSRSRSQARSRSERSHSRGRSSSQRAMRPEQTQPEERSRKSSRSRSRAGKERSRSRSRKEEEISSSRSRTKNGTSKRRQLV